MLVVFYDTAIECKAVFLRLRSIYGLTLRSVESAQEKNIPCMCDLLPFTCRNITLSRLPFFFVADDRIYCSFSCNKCAYTTIRTSCNSPLFRIVSRQSVDEEDANTHFSKSVSIFCSTFCSGDPVSAVEHLLFCTIISLIFRQ